VALDLKNKVLKHKINVFFCMPLYGGFFANSDKMKVVKKGYSTEE